MSYLEIEKIKEKNIVPWAATCEKYNNDPDERRSAFKHDEDEFIYSSALRRLADKTQIVVKPEFVEQYRSRLTHTLEVQQIAESIGSHLSLNNELINAIACGHDLGHCPYGHAGERAIQGIFKANILPLCDLGKLKINLTEALYFYNIKVKIKREIQPYYLFHHAVNSVRIIERKMKGIGFITKRGIITHSWSPWQNQSKIKYGIPDTLEAQAVAIADQIAGINHDTEDILNCKESDYDIDKIKKAGSKHIDNKGYLKYSDAYAIFNEWFLTTESTHINGWGRKKRLRNIINSVIDYSSDEIYKYYIAKEPRRYGEEPVLQLDKNIKSFLSGYESFIRSEIIQVKNCFKQRDAQAEAEIGTAFNFFKIRDENDQTNIKEKEKECINAFKLSISDDRYNEDKIFIAFINSLKKHNGDKLRHYLEIIDFVCGMTDTYLHKIIGIANEQFNNSK
ncbi:MAG: HD domain-containing protein [Candidatus Edwardsbacteria bacterium]|nr:HD domain-containing protein [Candidatus Edwardsbacteria bacterium]MBU1576627.1 HD domain-containing protein [Candidatus Edwardsbacteria bacterium]MBU2594970.1 HD domain-containing protein [Candidatus Edwardsbacteria bacterium]